MIASILHHVLLICSRLNWWKLFLRRVLLIGWLLHRVCCVAQSGHRGCQKLARMLSKENSILAWRLLNATDRVCLEVKEEDDFNGMWLKIWSVGGRRRTQVEKGKYLPQHHSKSDGSEEKGGQGFGYSLFVIKVEQCHQIQTSTLLCWKVHTLTNKKQPSGRLLSKRAIHMQSLVAAAARGFVFCLLKMEMNTHFSTTLTIVSITSYHNGSALTGTMHL
jgi:hypothetical protein